MAEDEAPPDAPLSEEAGDDAAVPEGASAVIEESRGDSPADEAVVAAGDEGGQPQAAPGFAQENETIAKLEEEKLVAAEALAAAREAAAAARDENKKLQEKIGVLTEQVDQLINQQIDQLPADAVATAQAAQTRCAELEAAAKKAAAEAAANEANLKSRLAKAEGDALASGCQLEETKQRLGALREKSSLADRLGRQVEELKEQLRSAEAAHKEERQASLQASRELEEAGGEAAARQAAEAEEAEALLVGMVAKLEGGMSAFAEEVGKRLSGLDARVAAARSHLCSGGEAIRDGQEALPKLQAQIQGVIGRLHNSEERNADLRAEVAGLQAQLASYEEEAVVLRDHRAATRVELEAWQVEAHRLRQEAFRGQRALRELQRIQAEGDVPYHDGADHHRGFVYEDSGEGGEPYHEGADHCIYEQYDERGSGSEFGPAVSPSAAYWDGGAPLELAPHLIDHVAAAREAKDRSDNLWSQPIVPSGKNSAATTHHASGGGRRASSRPPSARPWSGVSQSSGIKPHSRQRPVSAMSTLPDGRRLRSPLPYSPEMDPNAICHHATVGAMPGSPTAGAGAGAGSARRPSSAHPAVGRRVWPASAPASPAGGPHRRSPLASSPQSPSSSTRRVSAASKYEFEPSRGFVLASAIPTRRPGSAGQPFRHSRPRLAAPQSAPQSPAASGRRPAAARPASPAARPSSAVSVASSAEPYTAWSDVNLPKQHEDPCCRCSRCRRGRNKSSFVYEEFATRDPEPFPFLHARSRVPGANC